MGEVVHNLKFTNLKFKNHYDYIALNSINMLLMSQKVYCATLHFWTFGAHFSVRWLIYRVCVGK